MTIIVILATDSDEKRRLSHFYLRSMFLLWINAERFSYAGIGRKAALEIWNPFRAPVSEFFVFEMRARFGQALLWRL
jgi:hypothetical protein